MRAKFHRHTSIYSRNMSCWIHQRITWFKTGAGWKFIYFWKLHTIPFLHAKFQLILIILNFDDFGGPPSKIRGRGSWVWSMTTFKMTVMDSQDLDLEEKHHVTPPPLLKKWAGQREQKVMPYQYFPPTYISWHKTTNTYFLTLLLSRPWCHQLKVKICISQER